MNIQNMAITREEFLNKKRDYSPLLVHLTKAADEISTDGEEIHIPAYTVLEWILKEKTLIAFHYFCLFNSDLDSPNNPFKDLFRVACFTETPIDQIDILVNQVYGRGCKFEPYGLVFTKDYIREKEGNPVFYVGENMFDPLWQIYNDAKKRGFSLKDNKVLALVNRCDKQIDFHWEREWRIVGDLKFELSDIFCGLCPENEIPSFENNFCEIKFIDPHWGINKILQKLVGK